METGSEPPAARVEIVRTDYFGTTIEDPYAWMEDWQSEESRAYLQAQGAYAHGILEDLPERSELRERISQLRDVVPVLGGFQMAGGRTFYMRRDPEENVAKLAVRLTEGAEERVLFDPNALEGEEHTSIDWFRASRDGRLVAYGTSPGGSENSILHVLDVDSGEHLPDTITRTQLNAGTLYWLADNKSFLYNRMRDVPEDADPSERYLDSTVHLHRLGADPEDDLVVFGRGINPNVEVARSDFPFVAVVPESAWALGLVAHGVQNELTVYALPLSDVGDPAEDAWKKVVDVEDAVTTFDISGDTFYALTHKNAPRFRVVAIDLQAPSLDDSPTIVPESGRVVENLLVAGGFLLTLDLDAGINRIRRVALDVGAPGPGPGTPEDVPLPFDGAISGMASEPGGDDMLLQIQSFIQSPQIYRYSVQTGEMENTGWVPKSPIDMSEIEITETFAPAKDGVRIPLTIIHRTGLVLDGSNPTLLRAYGSYGLNYPVGYAPQMLAWYERSGVLAIARIRGGGELGQEWHDAGRLLNKQNTIDDFIACAEYLIDRGYTRPGRLAGEGTSAGGIPSGGGLTQRPDLWAAMVMRVAATDMTSLLKTGAGPANISEFGDVSTPEGFRAHQIINAYWKVRDGVAYPAALLTTGMNDPRVVPSQAMKMTARLQAASSSGKPVLMRVETSGGHGIGASRKQIDEELADEMAFLLWRMS